MNDTTETTPGTTGSIQQRVTEVIENEVPGSYATLATRRVIEVVEDWQANQEETVDRVRQWFELYGPTLSKSASGDLARILADQPTA